MIKKKTVTVTVFLLRRPYLGHISVSPNFIDTSLDRYILRESFEKATRKRGFFIMC